MTILLYLLLIATPFWETKAPADWTNDELMILFTNSPWAQMMTADKYESAMPAQAYLATAAPMQEAEHQREIRTKRSRPPGAEEDPLAVEYRLWLEDNRATQIVLAVRVLKREAFNNASETHHMEQDCVMRVGGKKYKLTGHFPPNASDPYLRLAFPRKVEPSDKNIVFELYVPGVTPPFRTAEFKVKELMLKGKLEM